MTTSTNADINELRDLILALDRKIDNKIDALDRKIDTKIDALDKKIEVFQARTEERFNTIDEKFKTLDEKFKGINTRLGDFNTRLNTMTIGFLSIVGILVTGLVGIIGKVVFFPNQTL